jgi:hypothetical protein
MAAGKHGSPEITFSIDASPGGSLTNMTNYLLTIGGAKIENVTQASHAFGDSWAEMLATGFARVPAIQVTGFFDDTATTGPHTVFQVTSADRSPTAATRTVAMVFSSTTGSTFGGESIMASYEVLGKNGALTEFAAVIQPVGAWAWS